MDEISVTLGDVTFKGFEVPESIRTGGSQVTKVHKQIGGVRIVDSMGRDDAPLTWSGTFLGEDALTRSQQLDAMRIAGEQITLTFSQYRYLVTLSEYQADVKREYWIPYTLTCVVVQDQSQQTTQSDTTTIDDAVMSDITSAQSLQASSGVA